MRLQGELVTCLRSFGGRGKATSLLSIRGPAHFKRPVRFRAEADGGHVRLLEFEARSADEHLEGLDSYVLRTLV